MDPQAVEEFRLKAKAAGYSDAEIEQQLVRLQQARAETSATGMTGLRNIGRSAVQGATFNFGDEILGVLPEWLGGGTQARDEMRSRDKAFRDEHPVIAGAAEIGAGFAVPGGALARVAKGAQNIRRAIMGGSAIGAGSGALAGAGAAEGGLGERAKAAVPAAGMGALVGGVIPGGIAGTRALFSPAARAAARLRGAVDRSGGPEGVIASAQAIDELGRGSEQILADQSRPLQQAADFAANNSEEGAEALERVIEPRARDINQRVLGDVQARVGDPNADQIADDLSQQRLQWANSPEGFEGLRQSNPAVLPVMGERFHALLQQPRVRDAIAQAREVGIIGPIEPDNGASFAVLQGTKERLDAAVGQAFGRPGLRDLAVRLRSARDELVGLMRQGVQGYGDVADEYSRRIRVEEMLEHGRQTYTAPDARGLRQMFTELSPEEQQAFRQGLVSELVVDLRRKATGQDAARQMVRMSPRHRDVMEVAFDSRRELERFIAEMEIEQQMSRTGQALAGSQTHRRGAAMADPAAVAADVALSGPAGAAMSQGRGILPKWLASRTAREMGGPLSTQGTNSIVNLMRRWQREPEDLLGAMAARRVPVAGGLFGQESFGE